MKNLILIVGTLLAVSFANAAPANSSKFDVRVPVKNWIKKMNDGFRVGIAQGSLNTNSRYRGSASSNAAGADISANESSSSKFQLHAGYEKIRVQEFGYSAFAIYHDMEFDGENARNMRLAGNATYGIDKQIYVYGGLNWGKYFGSEELEANINSGIGLQAGIGAKIMDRLNVEMEYLILQNEGRLDDFNVDVETKGILIKLNTPFSFNI